MECYKNNRLIQSMFNGLFHHIENSRLNIWCTRRHKSKTHFLHASLFTLNDLVASTTQTVKIEIFVTTMRYVLNEMINGHLVLACHCMNNKCEENLSIFTKEYFIKNECNQQIGKAKALCIPLKSTKFQPKMNENTKCIVPQCKNNAKKWILFGRSY